MRLVFHGAAREVGRSCIEVETAESRFLLDFGIKFSSHGFSYPEVAEDVCNIDAVMLSHAHLDHSGGLPLLEHHCAKMPVFCTHQTLAITRILLRDSYKIAHIKHLHPAYTKTDIRNVRENTKRVKPDKWYRVRDALVRFVNAGHIPGSTSIILEADGVRLLYTGDFNTRTTQLMKPADYARVAEECGPIDCLITESTYGNRVLPPRDDLQAQLVKDIKAVLQRGGSVLIPVFAVGRAQELLIMLSRENFGCPIYFDGLAKEVTRKVLLHQSTYVMNKDLLNKMYMRNVTLIGSQKRREHVAKEQPAIFVTTSGMMQGGPAIRYLRQMWHDEKNAVFLTGYQVHGTNGAHLIDEGYVHIDGWKTYVRCPVKKFDFSGHSDTDDIKQAIKSINPRILIAQHGDPESVDNLVAWGRKEGYETRGPKTGESIEVTR